MRFSTRPVSSPGRTENPPLLMRFLRTKSRSRSRSRSKKPIFFRRKNASAAGETQEPSSPKVTCMGQVRINRSKKPKPKPGTSRVVVGGGTRRRCGWVKNGFLCHPFNGKLKPTCFSPVWRKWKSFSHVSFSRKSEKRSSSSRSEPIFGRSSTVEPEETEEIRSEERKQEEEEEEANSDKSFTVTPPRNAFLLTRCRSAPYRSPSLGDNLWEEEEDESNETKETRFRQHDDDVIASPGNVLVSVERERLEEGSGRESATSEEAKWSVLGSPRRRRVVLTRCNSEPSRIGEKLVVPENRRFIFHCLTCLTNLTESLLKFREIQAQIQIKAHIEAMIHIVIEILKAALGIESHDVLLPKKKNKIYISTKYVYDLYLMIHSSEIRFFTKRNKKKRALK